MDVCLTIMSAVLAFFAITGCAGAERVSLDEEALIAVGVARIDITPEEPIRLSGYGARRQPTDDVRQRLTASAVAFGDRDPALLVTVDAVGVSEQITDHLAHRLAERSDVDRRNLVVAATHTHTAPHLRGILPNLYSEPIPPEHQEVIDRYTSRLEDQLLAVALEALANRAPSRIEWSKGSAGFAANRRVVEDGEWTGFGIAPEGPVDHELPVMRISAPDGAVRAVVVSYACHATVMDGVDNFIHGDWPGSARVAIESRYPGAVALVTAGTGGDQNPQPQDSVADADRHGEAVAAEVVRIFERPMRTLTDAPRGRLRTIELPLAEHYGRAHWEATAQAGGAAGYHAGVVLDRLNRGIVPKTSLRYPVQTWTFGDDLAMVFLAGEVVVDYALRLKREIDGDRLWVHAYANDVMAYIASDRIMAEGGYEVDQSMHYYDVPSRLAHGAEDRIVGTTRDMLSATYLVDR